MKANIITTSNVENKIRSVYDDSSGNNLLKLEYNNDSNNRYDHNIIGLVDLFSTYLVSDTTIPKLDYSFNTDIDKSYGNLSSMNKTINDNKDREKLIRNDITKTTNNIDLQYYESVIVIYNINNIYSYNNSF